MKLSALAATLSLAATPPAEEQTPLITPETETYIMPCIKGLKLEDCLEDAKAVSLQTKAAILTMYQSDSGQMTYTLVMGNMKTEIDPKDVFITVEPLPAPAPARDGMIFIPAV